MPSLIDLMLEGRKVEQHGPWPRAVVDAYVWKFAPGELAQGRWSLLGLWGEPGAVHMAIIDRTHRGHRRHQPGLPRSRLSLGRPAPPAGASARAHHQRPVRTDGRRPAGSPPLARSRPMGRAFSAGRSHRRAVEGRRPTVSCAAEGDGLHQIAVGPVHAGIIEPGHFRFTASGETVVRLEQRLGYTHKGIEGLMTGASLERAAQLAGRVSGDSTVAYAYAFSRAAEAALAAGRCPIARSGCARCSPNSSGSPTISATSARSATMPPSA